MKRLLQLGFILGLAGPLAAAYFMPWFEYQRYRSAANVVANGGRVEQFLVRLPADRVGPPIATDESGASTVRLEHFKLRDREGNVIGLLARHELEHGEGIATAWLLTIPSRGSIVLAAEASERAFEAALATRSLAPGESLESDWQIEGSAEGSSVAATGEFAGIDFVLGETLIATGLDDEGQLRGTLQLNTTGRRAL